MTQRTCAVCGHELTIDQYATGRFDHYRCPHCREGGAHNPTTGRTIGPVFNGHTPIAQLAYEQTHQTTTNP